MPDSHPASSSESREIKVTLVRSETTQTATLLFPNLLQIIITLFVAAAFCLLSDADVKFIFTSNKFG